MMVDLTWKNSKFLSREFVDSKAKKDTNIEFIIIKYETDIKFYLFKIYI